MFHNLTWSHLSPCIERELIFLDRVSQEIKSVYYSWCDHISCVTQVNRSCDTQRCSLFLLTFSYKQFFKYLFILLWSSLLRTFCSSFWRATLSTGIIWCDRMVIGFTTTCPISSLGTLVSSTNKTNCHIITEILLKVVFNTMNHEPSTEGIICSSHLYSNVCQQCLISSHN